MTVASIDIGAFEEPVYRSSRTLDSWLMTDMPSVPAQVLRVLEEGVDVRIVVMHDGQRTVWVGTIVERRRTSYFRIRLWGSGEERRYRLSEVLRAGVVPPHSFNEFTAVCQKQRNGEPAGIEMIRERKTSKPVEPQGTVIELSDEAFEQVEAFANSKQMTSEQATERLVTVGIRRLAALRKWQPKRKTPRSSVGDEPVPLTRNYSGTTRSIDRVTDSA